MKLTNWCLTGYLCICVPTISHGKFWCQKMNISLKFPENCQRLRFSQKTEGKNGQCNQGQCLKRLAIFTLCPILPSRTKTSIVIAVACYTFAKKENGTFGVLRAREGKSLKHTILYQALVYEPTDHFFPMFFGKTLVADNFQEISEKCYFFGTKICHV